MRLLLISNSTMAGQPFLDYPKYQIKEFLGNNKRNALFIPYAAVTFSYDQYEEKVKERFNEIGHSIVSIHHFSDPISAVEESECIVVGGGNTWELLKKIHENGLIEPIREKVLNGTPYIGWSAGSNIACPTIRTTNDMPITDPLGFDAFNLIPFQINPHYLDTNPENHAGETREQRIEEFIEINRNIWVAGLREGSMLLREENRLTLIGNRKIRLFRNGQEAKEMSQTDDLSFLLFS